MFLSKFALPQSAALIIILCLSFCSVKSQDPFFTQPMSSFSQLNPALTGKDQNNTLFMTGRYQWLGIFSSYFGGYYHYLSTTNSYFGGDFLHDRAGEGIDITNAIGLNYSQNIKVGKIHIRPAIRFQFINKQIDASQLIVANENDPALQNIDTYANNVNISSGFLLSYLDFNFGLAAHNILSPKLDFSSTQITLPARFAITFDKTFTLKIKSKELLLSPYVMVQLQGPADMEVFGVNIQFWKIILGTSYRMYDAVNSMIGFKSKYFSVIYSYDYTISRIGPFVKGSHELGIQFKPFQKKKKAHKNLMPLKSAFLL